MVHIIELVGQPKVEFAQQVTVSVCDKQFMNYMNRGLQLKPADSEGRSDRKKTCSLNDDDDAVSTLNCRCTKTTATLSQAAAIVNKCKDI